MQMAGVFVVVLSVLTSGCRDVRDQVVAAEERGPTPGAAATSEHTWFARSLSGTAVRVAPEPDPPVVGRLRLVLTVEGAVQPSSVDLVSPTMPMHGVVRVPVVNGERGPVADIDVPMEGDWALYVNFADGTETDGIPFTVAAADSVVMEHHHH